MISSHFNNISSLLNPDRPLLDHCSKLIIWFGSLIVCMFTFHPQISLITNKTHTSMIYPSISSKPSCLSFFLSLYLKGKFCSPVKIKMSYQFFYFNISSFFLLHGYLYLLFLSIQFIQTPTRYSYFFFVFYIIILLVISGN